MQKYTIMKAAVLHQLGHAPVYEDFPDPIPVSPDQLLLTVKAAAIKNLDKLRAGGAHYASYTELPVVVGIDGVGVLEDGTRVYAQGLTGMIAEKALIRKDRNTILTAGILYIVAAAQPNAVLGGAMGLLSRAGLKKGETVLINGATGVTGQLAVQLARHYGASTVIATGRNPRSLEKLEALGAGEVLSLNQEDGDIIKKLKEIHHHTPIDIVIDYLWGHPAEELLHSLKGTRGFTQRIRMVTVGSSAGENIELPSGTLRSSAIEILGSGIGSLSEDNMQDFSGKILPELMELAAVGKLQAGNANGRIEGY